MQQVSARLTETQDALGAARRGTEAERAELQQRIAALTEEGRVQQIQLEELRGRGGAADAETLQRLADLERALVVRGEDADLATRQAARAAEDAQRARDEASAAQSRVEELVRSLRDAEKRANRAAELREVREVIIKDLGELMKPEFARAAQTAAK